MKPFSKYYGLDINLGQKEASIRMEMSVPILTTAKIPQTYYILNQQLPKVLVTECFNEEKLPFDKEVKDTEIGHLFEHILLQNILDAKLALGYENFVVDGVTQWDWNKDRKGIFHINISLSSREEKIFNPSLIKTNLLVNKILSAGFLN